ncbi:unnamed protein product [Gordionus sp. m RMFG-2023]
MEAGKLLKTKNREIDYLLHGLKMHYKETDIHLDNTGGVRLTLWDKSPGWYVIAQILLYLSLFGFHFEVLIFPLLYLLILRDVDSVLAIIVRLTQISAILSGVTVGIFGMGIAIRPNSFTPITSGLKFRRFSTSLYCCALDNFHFALDVQKA